jgi:hypothetical protein
MRESELPEYGDCPICPECKTEYQEWCDHNWNEAEDKELDCGNCGVSFNASIYQKVTFTSSRILRKSQEEGKA